MVRIEKRGRYKILTPYPKNIKYSKKIPNTHTIFFAESGHGKTLSEEHWIEEYHNHGINIIVPTEKFKHRLEIAFCIYYPKERYHLDYLDMQGKTPGKKEAIIHALWCFNYEIKKTDPNYKFWLKKTFPKDFFTIDVKNDVTPDLWSILFECPTDYSVITAVSYAQRHMKNYHGVRDLIRIASNAISKNKVHGNRTDIDTIKTVLEPIAELGFLAPANCEYNLESLKILLDKKNYHIFHYGFLPLGFEKEEYFTVNVVMEKLISDYEKYNRSPKYSNKLPQILWVLQEINAFLPDKSKKKYVNKSSELMETNMKQIRSINMSSVADGQNVYRTAEGYRDNVPLTFYGRISTTDVERLAKVRRYKIKDRLRLESMPKGHYYMKGSPYEFVFPFPSHRHCEEGEDFNVVFSQNYPDKLKYHKQEYEYMKQLYDDELLRQKKIEKRKKRKKIQKNKEKKLKEIEKMKKTEEEKKELKKKLISTKEEMKKNTYIEAYRKSEFNPENKNPLTWVQIAEKLGVTDKTAKKYAKEGKKLVQQDNKNSTS